MGERHTRISRTRRLLVVAGALGLLAAAGAPTAAAGLGLPLSSEAALPVPELAAVPDAPAIPETPVLPELTLGEGPVSETLAQATEPVLDTVEEALAPTAEVSEALVAPMEEAVGAVGETAEALLRQTAPASTGDRGAAPAPAAGGAAPAETVVLGEVARAAAVQPPSVADTALPATVLPTPILPDRSEVSRRRALDAPLAGEGTVALPALPSVPRALEGASPDSNGAKAHPSPRRTPAPLAPSAPGSGVASASVSAGAAALVLLLAALAAVPLLVAPGLGRGPRLGRVPWPQPILQLSLERPG